MVLRPRDPEVLATALQSLAPAKHPALKSLTLHLVRCCLSQHQLALLRLPCCMAARWQGCLLAG